MSECNVCMGHGFWPIGDLCPIGRMDAGGWGHRVIKCPWCESGHVASGDRYRSLVAEKIRRDANCTKDEVKE